MLKRISLVAALLTFAITASAQEKKVTVADFAGTWNIEVMSHQIALVIEPKEANHVTATIMVMGNDVPLKGELVDKTIKLVGVPVEGAAAQGDHVAPPGAQAIVVTLQDNGTLAGEMMTNRGPVKWTGEKLRTRKKG